MAQESKERGLARGHDWGHEKVLVHRKGAAVE